MENLKPYLDERKCLGVDCVCCLDSECVLFKQKEDNNVLRLSEQIKKN